MSIFNHAFFANGYGLMDQFYSHYNIITGHKSVEIRLMARTLGLEVDEV
jgi:hypothetical protein